MAVIKSTLKFCSTCRCFLFAFDLTYLVQNFMVSIKNHQQHLAKELQENPLNCVHQKLFFCGFNAQKKRIFKASQKN